MYGRFCDIFVAIDEVFIVMLANMPGNIYGKSIKSWIDFFRMSLTDADMESIRELFVNFDSNSDGTISNRELQHFINSIQGKADE